MERVKTGTFNPFAPNVETHLRPKNIGKEPIKNVEAAPAVETALPPADAKITAGEEGLDIVPNPDTPKIVADTPPVVPDVDTPPEIKTDDVVTPPQEDVPPVEDAPEDTDLVGLYQKVGLQLKEDGFISEDTEIPADADGDTVYNLYREANKAKLEAEVTEATKAQVMQSLKEAGINEQDLSYAMAIRGGTNPALLFENTIYENYSKLDVAETPDTKKIEVISKGLELGGLSKERVEKYVTALELQGEDAINEEFTQYQSDFKIRHDNFLRTETEKANKAQQDLAQTRKQNDMFLNNVFTTSSIKDEPLSSTQLEDIRESLSVPNTIVEQNGQQYKATEFQKFLLDIEKDFQTQLYLFKIMKYRSEELNGVQNKAVEAVRKDFMGKMPVEVEVDNSKKVEKKKETKVEKNKFNFGKKLYSST